MDEFEVFLTDEFVEFSKKIAELHATKKHKAEEFRALHAKFKSEIADLDQAAKDLADGWEIWKSNSVKGVKK